MTAFTSATPTALLICSSIFSDVKYSAQLLPDLSAFSSVGQTPLHDFLTE